MYLILILYIWIYIYYVSDIDSVHLDITYYVPESDIDVYLELINF
jgi:hypothetical protein